MHTSMIKSLKFKAFWVPHCLRGEWSEGYTSGVTVGSRNAQPLAPMFSWLLGQFRRGGLLTRYRAVSQGSVSRGISVGASHQA